MQERERELQEAIEGETNGTVKRPRVAAPHMFKFSPSVSSYSEETTSSLCFVLLWSPKTCEVYKLVNSGH